MADVSAVMELLFRVSRGLSEAQRLCGGPVEHRETERGIGFDVYRPRQAPRATVIAVHGVTLEGGRERRLVRFARGLAHAGITCLVPTLPGLAACRFERADLDALGSVVEAAHRSAQEPPGLIGFSYGASYALLAAARRPEHVRFVLAVGAYHSLSDLLDAYAALPDPAPDHRAAWDDFIYLHLVLTYRLRQELAIPNDVADQMEDLLRRYCHEAAEREKRELFERHLRCQDGMRWASHACDRSVLHALSPASNIRTLACPVSLIHDESDFMVPPCHARRLYAELKASSCSAEPRLLITPLVSHVSFADAFRVADLLRLAAVLTPLARSYVRSQRLPDVGGEDGSKGG